jgi:hypothetical protein
MDMEHKEINALKDEIKKELKLIYNANMEASGWDIPERDDKEMSKLILEAMQDALDELKSELIT